MISTLGKRRQPRRSTLSWRQLQHHIDDDLQPRTIRIEPLRYHTRRITTHRAPTRHAPLLAHIRKKLRHMRQRLSHRRHRRTRMVKTALLPQRYRSTRSTGGFGISFKNILTYADIDSKKRL